MNEGKMIMALTEQEKMRAAAKLHLSTGEALLAAAGGSETSSLFPQESSVFGRNAGYSSMANPMAARGLPSSMYDGLGSSFADRSLLMGMSSGISNPSNPLSDMGNSLGMGGMGSMGGIGGMSGMGSVLGPGHRDLFSGADILSAVDRNQMRMERMMLMRQRESMMLASRAEAWQLGMKMRSVSTSVVTPGSELDSESTLAALGNSMRKKSSPYIDASAMADPPEFELARRRTRGGVTEPFPEKLHRMLLEIEKEGNGHVISFFPHGRAFGIHDSDAFESKIMPKYFKQSRLSSFQRQLNLYGFTRIVSGPDSGGYYHELFLKGRPALCTHMRRVGIPKGVDRRKIKATLNKKEPDFYSMRPSL